MYPVVLGGKLLEERMEQIRDKILAQFVRKWKLGGFVILLEDQQFFEH